MPKILVSWSVAYDHLIRINQKYSDVIMPDQLATLSAWFLAHDVVVENGWTAHNIAYNLGLLWLKNDTVMLATVGDDYRVASHLEPYVSYDYLHTKANLRTPTAYIITDANNRQITVFYPGALAHAAEQEVKNMGAWDRVIIAPNQKEAMIKHAQEAHALWATVLFDPGQMLVAFSDTDIAAMAKYSNVILLNEYEYELVKKMTNWSDAEFVGVFDKVIVTKGKDGVVCRDKTQDIHIHWCVVANAVDPTGAGDALRSGLVAGLARTGDWTTALRLWNVMGSFAVEQLGTMHHTPSIQDIQDRFEKTYGISINLA